jgi:mannosyltransferase OCH1-like enzyme
MIHYFLEGEIGYDYTDSWRKFAGNMPRVKWSASTLPLDEYPQLQYFIENKQWSVLSDFVRRWAIYKHGGIYLDYDIELIKPINDLLELESFVCIEGKPIYANAAVTGGKKGNKHHYNMLEIYLEEITKPIHPNFPAQVGPGATTKYVEMLKGAALDETDMEMKKDYDGFITLPKEYFYPFNWNEKYTEDCIKPNTYGIHWWKHGW